MYSSVSLSVEQASRIEEDTWQQSNSKVWFNQRSGRVTASQMHSVLNTELSNPSVSLIKSICYPQKAKILSEACAHGCKHEDEARSIYSSAMKTKHSLFTIKASGLLWIPQVLLLELLQMALWSVVGVGMGCLKSSALIHARINRLKTELINIHFSWRKRPVEFFI